MYNTGDLSVSFFNKDMNQERLKAIAHQLKVLSEELEDALKENRDIYLEASYNKPASSLSYSDVNDNDGLCD